MFRSIWFVIPSGPGALFLLLSFKADSRSLMLKGASNRDDVVTASYVLSVLFSIKENWSANRSAASCRLVPKRNAIDACDRWRSRLPMKTSRIRQIWVPGLFASADAQLSSQCLRFVFFAYRIVAALILFRSVLLALEYFLWSFSWACLLAAQRLSNVRSGSG